MNGIIAWPGCRLEALCYIREVKTLKTILAAMSIGLEGP